MKHIATPSRLLTGIALVIPLTIPAAFAGDVNRDDALTRESPKQQTDALIDRAAEKQQLGYGTDGIAESADDPGLGSRSMLGAPDDGNPASGTRDTDDDPAVTQSRSGDATDGDRMRTDTNIDDALTHESPKQQPDALVDRKAEKALMGYGTDGIADNVDEPTLGSRSMLGAPDHSNKDFGTMDKDGNGVITKTEAGDVNEDDWKRIDTNADDEIDRAEFSALETQSEQDDR